MRQIGGWLTLLLFTVLSFNGLSSAQYAVRIVRVDVPFEFNVAGKDFPAGTYLIARTGANRLELRDARGRVLETVVTNQTQQLNGPANAKLLFKFNGGTHVLSQVWEANDPIGQELPVPRTLSLYASRKPAPVQAAGR